VSGASHGRPRRAVGLDGCADGWVAVELVDGRVRRVEVAARLLDVLAREAEPVSAAADVPIGLLDGPRDADAAARRLLPGRASSVFSTPPRAVVEAWRAGTVATHAEASALTRDVTGKGLSQQAWRLVPKIAEADEVVAGGTGLLEVHPEVAFAVAAGEPLPRKRSWAGLSARRGLLARLGVRLPARFAGDDLAAPDDVVDAAICAWVADGAAQGGPLLTVPTATAQRDHGRPVVVHARQVGAGRVPPVGLDPRVL
jgi:predicted RNase H-like nuclease